MEIPATRHLVLVGGGHAHVAVLRAFAMRPEAGLRITLVSPYSHATYSGMVPGVLAGQYDPRDAQIDIRALAARARASFLPDRVVRVDALRGQLELAERPPLAYDLLSLDIGSVARGVRHVGDGTNALPVKPIELAVAGISAALAKPPPQAGRHIVVVGAGAGGVEIAFALAVQLRREGKGSITLCDRSLRPIPERSERAARLVGQALTERGIVFLGGVEVDRIDAGNVSLAGGRTLRADLVIWATGAAGPPLVAASGLAADSSGFVQVGDDLRSSTSLNIFAAGDCATMTSHPNLPKAGVFAVRQGPVLAANLRRVARGATRMRAYRPQKRFLSLLNTGDGRAILSYGELAWHSRWAWRLKDRIDRAFLRKYAPPPIEQRDAMGGAMLPCGGCAAKAGADALEEVLASLDLPPSEDVLVGVHEADDAAVFVHPPGTHAVATIDAFPPFSGDLFLVGQVAAVNAASDLYAMGAEGSAALALVCLSGTEPRQQQVELEHVLRGAMRALGRLGIPLAGGHTIAGEQLLVGFSMHGWVHPQRVLRKTGARPGDLLILTKALGTGVVLAAARAGFAPADWVEATHTSMLRSNGAAMRLLRDLGAHACTDVTGFGLGGHLAEVLVASGVGARLWGEKIPALPGAFDLLRAGWRSSFHPTNERAVRPRAAAGLPDSAESALLFDPQTSGGLLVAFPPQQAEALATAAALAGETYTVIGEIIEGAPLWQLG